MRNKPMKRKTNEQIVRDMMNFSKFGALSQMFIMDALTKHANAVAASTPADYPEGSMVHPEAWIGVAKEISEKLKEHYK
jgi:hypothetical protein